MDYLNVQKEEEKVQYIVVKFGGEQYGIDIKYIDNIVRLQRITRVPKVQKYIKGVTNLRGEIIPVVSIRLKMGLGDDEYTKSTRIIIIRLDNGDIIGILVDEVKGVINLGPSSIERVSYDAKEEKSNYLYGVGKDQGELISLLDMNLVFADKEAPVNN